MWTGRLKINTAALQSTLDLPHSIEAAAQMQAYINYIAMQHLHPDCKARFNSPSYTCIRVRPVFALQLSYESRPTLALQIPAIKPRMTHQVALGSYTYTVCRLYKRVNHFELTLLFNMNPDTQQSPDAFDQEKAKKNNETCCFSSNGKYQALTILTLDDNYFLHVICYETWCFRMAGFVSKIR